MAQNENGKRVDRRPKDPVVPPHLANADGVNSVQKRAFAKGEAMRTAVTVGDSQQDEKPARKRAAKKDSSAAPAKAAPKNGRRRGAKKDVAPAPASGAEE